MEIKKEHIKMLDSLMHLFYKRMNNFNVEINSTYFQGVTSIEISILGIVGESPDVILKEIGEQLQVPASTLTNAVDRLENRNLLMRSISKRDRRSFGLILTDEGRKLYQEHEKAEQITWNKILGTLESDEEVELFLSLMKKIAEGIK
ncbi:MarR family winged helix-turn-helix transcriptional regulator [Ruminiclostridium cellobioparum]|uniref:Transcriptional regulator n=1 Tax=Ruminiclostridium cellobioparum subsp. termitidis CT1112 TaxID=1195236 RepID=S0FSU9_RUMCE|nr:MarR family transcriptional regulator [Ruminiclostridium cellobioparum]EMS73396.1 transcriptional regulator [Ruminiclostridium cellobioparum subsp. termitidis CT1112]